MILGTESCEQLKEGTTSAHSSAMLWLMFPIPPPHPLLGTRHDLLGSRGSAGDAANYVHPPGSEFHVGEGNVRPGLSLGLN